MSCFGQVKNCRSVHFIAIESIWITLANAWICSVGLDFEWDNRMSLWSGNAKRIWIFHFVVTACDQSGSRIHTNVTSVFDTFNHTIKINVLWLILFLFVASQFDLLTSFKVVEFINIDVCWEWKRGKKKRRNESNSAWDSFRISANQLSNRV